MLRVFIYHTFSLLLRARAVSFRSFPWCFSLLGNVLGSFGAFSARAAVSANLVASRTPSCFVGFSLANAIERKSKEGQDGL